MEKGLKILYSLVGIVLLTILGNTIFLNQGVLKLKALSWLPVDFASHGVWKVILAQYFLWTALVLFVILFLAILVVIFFPCCYSELELADNNGKLKLKKSAVEGYVKSLVQSEGVMKNPNVTVNIYKKKFKVDVKGQVIPRLNVIAHTEQLRKDLESGLKVLFGVEHSVDLSVEVKDIVNEKALRTSRVE